MLVQIPKQHHKTEKTMSYEFSYKPKDFIETRNFGYKIIASASRIFSYVRDFYSDLSLYNAPVFLHKEIRGGFLPGIPGIEKQSHPYMWFPPYIDTTKLNKPVTSLISPKSVLKDEHGTYINNVFKGVYKDGKSVKIESGFNIKKDGFPIDFIPESDIGLKITGRPMYLNNNVIQGIIRKGISPESIISAKEKLGVYINEDVPSVRTRNQISIFDIINAIKDIKIDIYSHVPVSNRISMQWWEWYIADRIPYFYTANYFKYNIVDKVPYPYSAIKNSIISIKKHKYKYAALFNKMQSGVLPIKTALDKDYTKFLYKHMPYDAMYMHSIFGYKNTCYDVNIIKHSLAQKYEYTGIIYRSVFTKKIFIKNAYENIMTNMYHDRIFNASKNKEVSTLFKKEHESFIVKDTGYLKKNPKDTFGYQKLKCLYREKEYSTSKQDDNINVFRPQLLLDTQDTSTSMFRNIHTLDVNKTYLNMWKNNIKDSTINTYHTDLHREQYLLSGNHTEKWLIRNNIPVDMPDNTEWLNRKLHDLSIAVQGSSLYRKPYDLHNTKPTEQHLHCSLKEIFYVASEEWLYRERYEFWKNNTEVFLYRKPYDLKLKDYAKFLYHKRYKLALKDYTKFLYRERYPMFTIATESFLHRERYPMRFGITESWLKRERYGISEKLYEKWLHRTGYLCIKNNTEESVTRMFYNLMKDTGNSNVYRNPKFSSKNIIEIFINKFALDTSVNDTESSVVRLAFRVFAKNKEDFLKRKVKDIFNTSNEWLNSNLKYIYEFHQYMLYYSQKEAFIRDMVLLQGIKNTQLIDFHSWMYKYKPFSKEVNNKWLYKIKNIWMDNSNKWLYKYKNIDFYGYNFAYVSNKSIELYKDEWAYFNPRKPIHVYNNIWINKKLIGIWTWKDIALDKERNSLPDIEKPISGKRDSVQMFFKDWLVTQKDFPFMPYEDGIQAIKENNLEIHDTLTNAEHTDHMNIMKTFVSMGERKTAIFTNEIVRMQTLVKQMEKPVEKTFNWVWEYTPDQPLHQEEVYHGLDELLLPEKDVDYSFFEDYIFNKNTLRPRNPIQIIDDTTFIAKLPIKHPTPKYEEVGIVYLDVRSELMYKIFCRYYEIWYANIYKFGNMSMVDSLRLMLDYMYSWIVLEYSGTEYFDEALRVFRQIRWFGEKSVMKNSQYLIHYDKADLKCSLKNGILKEIDNDIGDTFIIRSDLNAIAANPAKYRTNAEMNLYIKTKEDTQISFNVSQAGGSLYVRLDGGLITNTNRNKALVKVDIPEGEHVLNITRPAEQNYASCYIGNIILKNAGFTNLEITYDPNLLLGNMPLDDVAKKMMELALIYDENADAFEKYRKGNLAVSELHKELMEYWCLHHENKIKGKRLTIKEAGI